MRTVLKATCGKHSKEISVSQITHFVAEDKYVIAVLPGWRTCLERNA